MRFLHTIAASRTTPALAIILAMGAGACKHEPPLFPEEVTGGGVNPIDTLVLDTCDPDTVYFQNTVLPLLITYCAGADCHDAITHEEGVRLYDYTHIMQQVTPGDPSNSDLWDNGINETGDNAMPPADQPQMTAAQEQAIYDWIMQGAQNNNCTACDTGNVSYAGTIAPLFDIACNGCHSGTSPDGSIDLTTYAGAYGVASDGTLAGAILHQSGFTAMPSSGTLPQCVIDEIMIWVDDGAPNN